ncbi:DUF2244 domain-containing protein [Thiolinea disciformis]|uniref:DUF2244 domain-containing protein n=1 Tax=Thiolinea disciformis TaxID=125614 RepID=UPI00036C7333|nr:DUF2244 domain-containing protein [Thiolinea disciformis]
MPREFVIQPNCSLSHTGRRNFLWVLAGLMGFIALGLAAQGFWPVMPFLGADLLLAVYAFAYVAKRNQIRERVVIDQDRLTIHHEEAHAPRHWNFPLHWVRVDLKPNTNAPLHGSRLLVGMQGTWIELASFLTQEERSDLAKALRAAITDAKQPQLGGDS